MNRTTPVRESDIERKWYVVDATGLPLGRLAAQVAQVLRGKHKPLFSYNMDCGDFVIVVNADRVVLTGGKGDELIHWHTGWPGGLRSVSRGKLLAEQPVRLVERAIWGMVPKSRLGKQIIKKLKVYAGPEHPHAAQNPEALTITKE
jgi:large subunit ribosomal protein L13